MTFIDEVAEPAVQVIRAKSCPPMPKTLPMPKDATKLHAMREQKQRALQVSKLQERSQLVSTGRAAPHEIRQATPSLGSYGHPNICRRPCILMVKGTCQKGSDCGFCHQDHELRPPSFDKQQREFLKRLPAVTFMELILPYVREKVEASELPGLVIGVWGRDIHRIYRRKKLPWIADRILDCNSWHASCNIMQYLQSLTKTGQNRYVRHCKVQKQCHVSRFSSHLQCALCLALLSRKLCSLVISCVVHISATGDHCELVEIRV